ncbi:MAG: hypothetical protein DWQ31_04735 [Planctomycetota bacterium]|nr:MAG: hypothetical protein DWQ31_04735 [Planctomycetota bacterium]
MASQYNESISVDSSQLRDFFGSLQLVEYNRNRILAFSIAYFVDFCDGEHRDSRLVLMRSSQFITGVHQALVVFLAVRLISLFSG